MKYIVTGGAGFIGSHLIEELIAQNHEVICIDDLSSGFESNIPQSEKVTFINKMVQGVNINQIKNVNGVFHLAAQASVPKSIDDFFNSSKNNLESMLKVFDWTNKLNIPIVYATSSAVYGNLPVGNDEIEEYNILSPYAQDKLTMEHYAKMVWNVYQTRSLGLRFFNVYGPRQDPTNPYSGVISIFIDRLLKGLSVTVNGGYQTRDFIFVSDIVNSLVKSMKKLHREAFCDTFNAGTGVSVSIDELLQTLIKIVNIQPQIIKAKLPKGDPEKSAGTYQKIEQIIGLNINDFVSMEDGLEKTIKYFQENE